MNEIEKKDMGMDKVDEHQQRHMESTRIMVYMTWAFIALVVAFHSTLIFFANNRNIELTDYSMNKLSTMIYEKINER